MKLGAYTACLHDKPLEEALGILRDLGLNSAEINSGGFLATPHLPVEDILESESARAGYLASFAEYGITLTALNCNGNPLHPDPEVREKHSNDIRRSIRLAHLLGIKTVITMSGLPGSDPDGKRPSWTVIPWDSVYKETLDYQWDEVAVPFWREIDALAADNGVKVAIEMHPQNLVFNPPTLKRLVEKVGATHVGAEMDPSHLFWQGMDPVAAVRYLGALVVHAAAKDVRINEDHASIYGVLDERFRRLSSEEDRVNLGGDEWANKWPEDSAWDFVALGRGHDVGFWTRFVDALREVDPEMAVNIEHEDTSLGRIEGLKVAADVLLQAAAPVHRA
jgi:sugar phosphate isomerase/epimerase